MNKKSDLLFKLGFLTKLQKTAGIAQNIKELGSLLKGLPSHPGGLGTGIKDLAKWTFRDVSPRTLALASQDIGEFPLKVLLSPKRLGRGLGDLLRRVTYKLKGMDPGQVEKAIGSLHRTEAIKELGGSGIIGRPLRRWYLRLSGANPKNIASANEFAKKLDLAIDQAKMYRASPDVVKQLEHEMLAKELLK